MSNTEQDGEYVYLDYAAATPLLPEAKAAMDPFFLREYGNPSSVHRFGQRARAAVENARAEVASAIQVRPEYVTFTGGGTEANNLALVGTIEALHKQGREYGTMEVVTTRIEHPSLGETMEFLKALGVVVHYVKVNEEGSILLAHLQELLNVNTVLVSCAYANSEIGTVQPLHSLKKTIRAAEEKFQTKILFHVDAAQAPLWLSCQFDTVGADFIVLDAGKCGGPKGVGVLIRSRRAEVVPIMQGGGQEQGLRPGTENVAGIVGSGVAIALAQASWRERAEVVGAVRDEGIEQLLSTITGAILNGPTGAKRLANNINISIPGFDTEYATVVLDEHGFAVSTRSACAGAGGGESSVVREISGDPARASSTLRLSLGPTTTVDQLTSLAQVLKKHQAQMAKLTT